MYKILKRIAGVLFPSLGKLVENCITLAIEQGQWKSIRSKKSENKFGHPIPWYTYPAIEYLEGFDFRDCKIFEYGSGNSSLYWATHAKSVVSVESNKEWFEFISKRTKQNLSVLYREEGEYPGAITEQNDIYQIIIIDGNWRKSCVRLAVNYLADGGMIILDNSERAEERDCAAYLRELGFFQIDFSGFGPINNYCWTTSIFLKANTVLQHNFSTCEPKGAISVK